MRKALLFIVFCCGISLTSFAQKNKDFILTLHKDTVFGKIKIDPEEEHITFTHQRKRIYFHPKTLKAFGIYKKVTKKYRCFKSITNAQGRTVFVEVLNEGKVKLYKYQKKEITAHNNYPEDLYYVGPSDKKMIIMTPDSYELAMKFIVRNHPNLLTKIADISYEEVPQIIASYNQYSELDNRNIFLLNEQK